MDKPKPMRWFHHDRQAVDEVRIVTVPRYKTSGLSGDEWRISARITCLYKGQVVMERPALNVDSAVRYLDAWLMQHMENGYPQLAGRDELCDQEGCSEKATVTYRLKKRYSREGFSEDEQSFRPFILCFCDRHKTRGDCGLEDADTNYERVTLNADGTIAEQTNESTERGEATP